MLPFFFGPVIFAVVLWIEYKYGNFFFLVWIAYVALPILDYLIPVDHENLKGEPTIRKYEKDKRFLIPLYTVVIMDFANYFFLLYRVSVGLIG